MEREEAIKIIEANCSCSDSKLREACAMFIPELRESEDERIRKYLIEELKASKSVGELKFSIPAHTKEKCIAYLEKQKEQKHPNGCFTCDEYKEGYAAGRLHGFTAGYNKAKQEQKPAWSEEDKRILKGIIGKIDHDQTYGVSKDEMLNFLKKL